MKVLVVGFIFLAAIASNSIAELNKAEYELQEKCGKHAAEYVKRQWNASYVNHYNRRLNKCFVLIDFQVQEGKDSISSMLCDCKTTNVTLLKDIN